MACKIYIDGASRGNPGKAGAGVAVFSDGKEEEEISQFLGTKTNNEAEYTALIEALEYISENSVVSCTIYSDSSLLVNQMKGLYKVKSEKVIPLYNKARKYVEGLDIEFVWVRREYNKVADSLANKAIDNQS